MRRLALSLLLLSCSCGKANDKQPPPPSSAPTAPTHGPATHTGEGSDSNSAKTAADDREDTEEFSTVKPAAVITHVAFLGWSKDESSYAVLAHRGLAMGELGGDAAASFYEVYDSRSGELVALFQDASALRDATPEDAVMVAWNAAKPKADWRHYAAKHAFTAGRPSVANGEFTMTTIATRGKLAEISRFSSNNAGAGTTLSWRVTLTDAQRETLRNPSPSDKTNDPLIKASPLFVTSITRGAATWPVLHLRTPFTLPDLLEEETPGANATLEYYWSPSGKRMLIRVTWQAVGMHEEEGWATLENYYHRTVGPQLKVIAAKDKLATTVATVEKSGYAVTVAESQAAPNTSKSMVYFRGPASKAAAAVIAKSMGADIEELRKPGWLSLIVVVN